MKKSDQAKESNPYQKALRYSLALSFALLILGSVFSAKGGWASSQASEPNPFHFPHPSVLGPLQEQFSGYSNLRFISSKSNPTSSFEGELSRFAKELKSLCLVWRSA
ncbi:MAG: hypothetical protein HY351_05730 [Candidatus Omnitrophica bacterium]|nr:hypothetical protein [Candidatus Omnitrophota bacterium]